MTACAALRAEADLAYSQLSGAFEGVPEGLAWAEITLAPDQYLHTNGTIIGVVQHIAACKFMYASHGFRGTEVRWRDCFDRLAAIDTSWEATKEYLEEAHRYWISSWGELTDSNLEGGYTHFRGNQLPAWKIIATVTQHDVYHAGQITVLASALTATTTPPDLRLDEERKHVMDLPGW